MMFLIGRNGLFHQSLDRVHVDPPFTNLEPQKENRSGMELILSFDIQLVEQEVSQNLMHVPDVRSLIGGEDKDVI